MWSFLSPSPPTAPPPLPPAPPHFLLPPSPSLFRGEISRLTQLLDSEGFSAQQLQQAQV